MMMRFIGVFAIFALLSGCFGQSSSGPDLRIVLDRTLAAMVKFDEYLKKNHVKKATDQHMNELAGFMQKVINVDPRFYKESLIAVKLLKDAKFEGYKDANSNGKVDAGEKKLFYVEVDTANKRLIATDAGGQSVGRGISGIATGLLAGALIGNLLGRQQSSGIKPGSFNNRKVTPSSTYARGRSRSGGRFGGK